MEKCLTLDKPNASLFTCPPVELIALGVNLVRSSQFIKTCTVLLERKSSIQLYIIDMVVCVHACEHVLYSHMKEKAHTWCNVCMLCVMCMHEH